MTTSIDTTTGTNRQAGRRRVNPITWVAAVVGVILAPRKPQRGMVTVEFIFGTLVVIAIVTIVATMLHDAKMAAFFADIFKKLVKMIFA
jgi:hypothetical protein